MISHLNSNSGRNRFIDNVTVMKFIKRLFFLLKLMFPSVCSPTSLLFLLLLCTSLLEQVVIYQIGIIPSKFYKTLSEKDNIGFQHELIMASILIVSIAFIHSTMLYMASILYIRWRELITRFLHNLYFKGTAFYNVNIRDKCIDNPDQRITQDVDKMCNTLSQIIAVLLISPFTIGYYIYQAWTSTGYIGPLSVFIFFLIMTTINRFLMSPVIRYFVKQEKKEGDFRYKHMQIRSHAEAVAFYRAGNIEWSKANHKMDELITTQHRLMNRKYALNFSIQLADYIGSILSYVAIAVPIFAGKYDALSNADLSALISKNAFVSIYLISCFTKLIDMSISVSDIAGAAHRICQLIESLNEYTFEDDSYGPKESVYTVDEAQAVNSTSTLISANTNSVVSIEEITTVGYRIKDLMYCLPTTDEVMLKGLDLTISPKINILITGESGCGKSSLLRVLGQLWTNYSGSVERFVPIGPNGMFYLPQKPYFTNGTLREQIVFPAKIKKPSQDQDINHYLECADLTAVVGRVGGLDTSQDINWFDVLSPGEMQRLSFVRLFYHKPHFAALDEATSQIGLQAESTMYNLCRELGITVLSVGHRESLKQYHDCQLHLDGKGGWTLTDIKPTELG
ncbi:lysosomal cobalamin transporter ABCD4-like [Tubulanus polymorphus]|uniref:lysosomal cobalamin transporter ABCD4-like n=1 Tax=Tubulanus polymorphus TaxID=672921 RepID=UPI003DA58CD3